MAKTIKRTITMYKHTAVKMERDEGGNYSVSDQRFFMLDHPVGFREQEDILNKLGCPGYQILSVDTYQETREMDVDTFIANSRVVTK